MFWQPVLDWLNQQSERDQKIIKIGSLLLSIFLFYSLIITPLTDGRESLKKQVAAAKRNLDYIKQGAAQIKFQGNSGSKGSRSGNQIVNTTARKNNINVTRISPNRDNTQLVLTIDEVEFSHLIRWVNDLQVQGIALITMNINQSGRMGYIKASLTVSQGKK